VLFLRPVIAGVLFLDVVLRVATRKLPLMLHIGIRS
jgi:hypothetical protein